MAPYVQPPRGGAGYVSIHRTNVHKLANKLLINIHTQGYRCATFNKHILLRTNAKKTKPWFEQCPCSYVHI